LTTSTTAEGLDRIHDSTGAVDLDPRLLDDLSGWLTERVHAHDVADAIGHDDAYRTWWRPARADARWPELLAVLAGADDVLTLLAVVERARAVSGDALPAGLQHGLAAAAARAARRRRAAARAGAYDLFVSYAHEDGAAVERIVRQLEAAGLRVFRDVECIAPGESIADRIHEALSGAAGAVVVVSHAYLASVWAGRELDALLARRRSGGLALYPVLIDDAPLPAELEDTFTVDLRGADEAGAWPSARLGRLVEALRR
jgi:TIR domain